MASRKKIHPEFDPRFVRARDFAIEKFLVPTDPESRDRHKSPAPAHNVVGVSIATKRKAGKRTATPCLALYVRDKFDPDRIWKKDCLPKTILGVPTDIVEVGVPYFIATQPGSELLVAESSSLFGSGTLGALVRGGNGRTYLLSNNHVLANENRNPPGTEVFPADEDARIARLKVFEPLRTGSSPNQVDCAIAEAEPNADLSALVRAPIGRLASSAPFAAATGRRVEKVGVTTDHTVGRVSSTTAAYRVPIDGVGYLFTAQIQIEDEGEVFCDHGDSGSLLVDHATRQAAGLVFARMEGFSLACPLSAVLTALSARLGSPLQLLTTP